MANFGAEKRQRIDFESPGRRKRDLTVLSVSDDSQIGRSIGDAGPTIRARLRATVFPRKCHGSVRPHQTCSPTQTSEEREQDMRKTKGAEIALLTILTAILLLTGAGAVVTWGATTGVEIGKHGWIALGLGTFFSLLVGCGLMALMFFGSRSGHDDMAAPFRRTEVR